VNEGSLKEEEGDITRDF